MSNKLTAELRAMMSKAKVEKTDCGCGCEGAGDCEKLTITEWMETLLSERTKFLHDPSGAPEDEGEMAKKLLSRIQTMSQMLSEMLVAEDQLPGWVQSHITVAHENLAQVMSYMEPKSKE